MGDSLGIIGLGYVGLPLAVQAAEKGFKVVGVDLNPELVAAVRQRISPYVNDKRFDAALKRVDESHLEATADINAIAKSKYIIVCVPTPTEDGLPDLSYVTAAAKQISHMLKAGQLVSIESTVNPGVTRDIVRPILEKGSGLKAGKDFYLVHCPERIDPGNADFFVGNLNRVVGGITDDCTQRAVDFYSRIIDANVIPMRSTEEAEFVKSWENSHRNVMIALANSAAIICDGLGMDIGRVLDGLQSKVDQFGLKLARPGIGPGGHCIPEDIHYVIRRARQSGIDTRFLDDAADLNDSMPRYAVRGLATMVKRAGERLEELNVALLGVAYKPDIADTRRSPAVEAGHLLARYAKSVIVHDSYIVDVARTLPKVIKAESLEHALRSADAVFIGTAHRQYIAELTPKLLVQCGVRFVLDGRNMLDKAAIENAGLHYKGIGQ